MTPLMNTEKITEQEVKEIFVNIEDIRKFTRDVLTCLEERMFVWEEDGQDHIGDILYSWVRRFIVPFFLFPFLFRFLFPSSFPFPSAHTL
jgi:hypothetical protein